MQIYPFLAEDDEDGIVIFKVEDGNNPKAYIWVKNGETGRIRVTNFYGLVSYFTHVGEPLLVCEKADQDAVDSAFERLTECPKEVLSKEFEDFNKDIERKRENKEAWDEYCEWEKTALEEVEKAKASDSGEVIF